MKDSLRNIIRKIVSRDATAKDLNAFDKFIHYQQGDSKIPTQEMGEHIWASIEKEVHSEARVVYFRRWLKMAASVALILSVGLAYYFNRTIDTESNWITITAEYGQKRTVKLSDGSIVKLNSGSSLSYSKVFDRREVILRGEAFFDVTRDESRPFQIITGTLTTTVLGTSFNIQSYPEDSSIVVSVTSGKVKLQHTNTLTQNTEILTPGEQGIFDRKSASLTKTHVSGGSYLAWQENILVFDRSPLREVKIRLERWYGVEVELEQAMDSNCLVEGSYTSEKLVNVLESLKFLGVLDYKIIDTTKVKITAKPCKN
jgi:transmembrane sensor